MDEWWEECSDDDDDGEMEEQMNGLMSQSELKSKLSCCRFLALRFKMNNSVHCS